MINQEIQTAINDELGTETLVAYLDILGFKEHVKKFVNSSDKKDKEILQIIKNAMADATKNYNIEEFKDVELIKVKQFSDCTCFVTPSFYGSNSEGILLGMFLTRIKGFNFQFIDKNLYLRGGISSGCHYQNENIIFSDGLIKAYDLEVKKAIYPRIVLDKSLTDRLIRLWKNQKDKLIDFGINKLLLVDYEGTVFLNPFNPFETMGNNIPENLKDKNVSELIDYFHNKMKVNIQNNIKIHENNERVQRKFLWLNELLKWNLNPNNSKIKFEYLLK